MGIKQTKVKEFFAKRSVLWLYPAFILPPIIARAFAIRSMGMTDKTIDYLGGYLSTLSVSMILLSITIFLPGLWFYVLGITLCTFYAISEYANFEHVTVLYSSIQFYNLKFMFDPTFVKGSGLAVSNPLLLFLMLFFPVMFLLKGKNHEFPFKYRILLLSLCIVASVSSSFVGEKYRGDDWRKYSFFVENIRNYIKEKHSFGDRFYNGVDQITTTEHQLIEKTFSADLSGTPRIPLTSSKPNILLVILEALGGGSFPSIAKDRYAPHVGMPKSDKLLRDGFIKYSNLINHTRQTNRGTYSLICGDYPNIGLQEAKMDVFVDSGILKLPCLPNILKADGYHSVYLQSARLRFMWKDVFMRQAGYDEVLGKKHFKRAYKRHHWGVDDRTFFEHGLEKIKELNQDKTRPWFLTLLNSGTHHPFKGVPKDFVKNGPYNTFPNAVRYLDLGFSEFLKQLLSMDLSNTLVVIVSDESYGTVDEPFFPLLMSQAWGPLFIKTPNNEDLLVEDKFMQTDMTLSILDYIGKREDLSPIVGRSVFRKYSQPRPLFFGNSHKRLVGIMEETDPLKINVCSYRLDECRQYTMKNGDIATNTDIIPEEANENQIRLLQEFMFKNEIIDASQVRYANKSD